MAFFFHLITLLSKCKDHLRKCTAGRQPVTCHLHIQIFILALVTATPTRKGCTALTCQLRFVMYFVMLFLCQLGKCQI